MVTDSMAKSSACIESATEQLVQAKMFYFDTAAVAAFLKKANLREEPLR